MAVLVACDWIISPSHAPGSITVGAAFRAAASRILAALMWLIIVSLSAPLMLIFPLAVYVWVRWAPSVAAIVIEGLGPIGALGRSWALTHGAWWHTAMVLLVAAISVAIVQWGVAAVFGLAMLAVVAGIGMAAGVLILGVAFNAVLTIIAVPFSSAIGAVLYYELRARAEGFDLEQRLLQDVPPA